MEIFCLSAFAQRLHLDLFCLLTSFFHTWHEPRIRSPRASPTPIPQTRRFATVPCCDWVDLNSTVGTVLATDWRLLLAATWMWSNSSEAAMVASMFPLKLSFLKGRWVGVCSSTDVDAALGLITCVWGQAGQKARRLTPERNGAWVQSDSSKHGRRWTRSRLGWAQREKSGTPMRDTTSKMDMTFGTHAEILGLTTTHKQISALGALRGMHGRESRYVKEVLDWYREKDSGGVKIRELSELLGRMTCLNALERKSWKSWRAWRGENCRQGIVMHDESVKNKAMDEK